MKPVRGRKKIFGLFFQKEKSLNHQYVKIWPPFCQSPNRHSLNRRVIGCDNCKCKSYVYIVKVARIHSRVDEPGFYISLALEREREKYMGNRQCVTNLYISFFLLYFGYTFPPLRMEKKSYSTTTNILHVHQNVRRENLYHFRGLLYFARKIAVYILFSLVSYVGKWRGDLEEKKNLYNNGVLYFLYFFSGWHGSQ